MTKCTKMPTNILKPVLSPAESQLPGYDDEWDKDSDAAADDDDQYIKIVFSSP